MLSFRYIAPAGTEITFRDLYHWVSDALTGQDRTEDLSTAIRDKYGQKHCFLMSSARSALAMLFLMLKKTVENKNKDQILLPAYTCYSLPAAAEIAGLQVIICDIDPQTLSYDLEKLKQVDFTRVIAMVSANLYGNPDQLDQLEKIAQQNNVIFIDDAAQSMNAKLDNRYAGTFGDIGIYSLDKGKNITSIQGGIIVTNDDKLALLIQEEINQLPWPNKKQKLAEVMKIIIYSILLRPWLYWIPANIPALGLGKTIYTTDYLFTRYSQHLSSLALRLFTMIDRLTAERCKNAKKITGQLRPLKGFQILTYSDDAVPACLRLGLLVEDTRLRNRLLIDLKKSGIGASTSYPRSIAQLDEIRYFLAKDNSFTENSQYVAAHILTLPVISYLTDADVQNIGKVFTRHFKR